MDLQFSSQKARSSSSFSVRAHTFSLSESRFRIYPRAHVLIGQEAGVGGQGIVGKNGVVVGGAGAGCVLAGWGVLFERRRQVQVLEGKTIKVQRLKQERTWEETCKTGKTEWKLESGLFYKVFSYY